jgi:hypothetical protein
MFGMTQCHEPDGKRIIMIFWGQYIFWLVVFVHATNASGPNLKYGTLGRLGWAPFLEIN